MSVSFSQPVHQLEWNAIAQESDVRLRDQAALDFAARLESNADPIAAASVYQSLLDASPHADLAGRARDRLEVLSGKGGFGARFELQLRGFVRQAADPRFVAPMLVGSLAFQLGRTCALGRLVSAAEPALWNRGPGARALAGLAGFAVEVPAFTLLQHALSPQPQDLGVEFRDATFSLAALKLFAFGGRQAVSALHSAETAGLSGFTAFSQQAIPQVSALLGLMAVHRAEVGLGWREPADGGALFFDSLATLLSLRVGERLGACVLGEGFAGFQRELELRAAGESRRAPLRVGLGLGWGRQPVLAGMPMAVEPASTLLLEANAWMSKQGDGEGRRPVVPGTVFVRDYRGHYPFASLEQAAETAKELRQFLMMRDAAPEERLKSLQSLDSFIEILKAHPEYFELQKDLRQLIRNPKIECLRGTDSPEEATAFWALDRALRVGAAEFSLEMLEKLEQPQPNRDALIEALREALKDPAVRDPYQPSPAEPPWRGHDKAFAEAIAQLRGKLLQLYAESLRGLITESPEVMEGMRLLSSPEIQKLARTDWQKGADGDGIEPRSRRVKVDMALAYAALLEAASMYQREISAGQRALLGENLQFLEPLASDGDERALRALIETMPYEEIARKAVGRLRYLFRNHKMMKEMWRLEEEVKQRREERTQYMVKKITAQQNPVKRAFYAVWDALGFRRTK